MSYLFQTSVEPATKSESASTRGNAEYLEGECKKETKSLLETNGRIYNIHDDFERAKTLVEAMGSKIKPQEGPHAQEARFVGDAWRMVSDNSGTIRGMVSAELNKAYQIGLDIRSDYVIGRMFYLAVQVWSTIGAYTGYSQDEGRR